MKITKVEREHPIHDLDRIHRVHSRRDYDARPKLRKSERNNRCWLIDINSETYDHSFEVEIFVLSDVLEVHVNAYLDGDESRVVTKAEYDAYLQEYIMHTPHPSQDPNQEITLEEADEACHSKFLIVNHEWFWNRVSDCVRRFEAAMFLFRLA